MSTKIAHTYSTCANRVDCCLELFQECEVSPDNYFHRIVIVDEVWVFYYDRLRQQQEGR